MNDESLSVPSLNRAARGASTREKTARRKQWAPPSRLDAPPAPPGYKHRWIRTAAGNQEDRTNVAGKLREGYEFVRADEHPDFAAPVAEDGRHAGVISVGNLVLARIPEETVEERNAYYNSRAHDLQKAVDNDMLKANQHDTMRIHSPERSSRTSFGSSQNRSK
jgi:hypothetical protein